MDGIQMEPVGKYKADRNGSAKAAAWRNMVDQDLDDVAFLADSDKAREARDLRDAPIAVCSQRRAICLAALVLGAMFATALIVVYATPQPDCPCANETSLIPGQPPTDADSALGLNKERIATNGQLFPWRGARLPTFIMPKHYNLWLHPNLTIGNLRGEVSIDFKVDRDTTFIVLNVRDLNVTERALFRSGGAAGPKIVKVLDYPPADQTYIEFKDKLRRKYNYTLSLRFITKLDRSDKQRGFYLTGTQRNRCAISRFWLTHARSVFPCLDEPHFRATFRLTIVRDRFHVSLTNMPIVATEEAGFYLGHRLLQDEFETSPPMAPHMMAVTVCRLQRRAAPAPPTEAPLETTGAPSTTKAPHTTKRSLSKGPTTKSPISSTKGPSTVTPEMEDDDFELSPPEISLYSDQQVILDESGPLLEWIQKTLEQFSYELNTPYPLRKLDIVVVGGGAPLAEGWGLLTLAPASLANTQPIARLLAMQWFGGLVSPRWWSSQWLLEALTSVLAEKASSYGDSDERRHDSLLLDHILPALRLDSSNSVRAVASPRLERADIEAAADELSLHKGAAIVSMAIDAAGEAAGRAALSRLLREHRYASADARDLWRALQRDNGNGNSNTTSPSKSPVSGGESPVSGGQGPVPGGHGPAPAHAWDGWCERPGYPLLSAMPSLKTPHAVLLKQERFVMSAEPPAADPPLVNHLLTADLRLQLDELFYEPENITEPIEDDNCTTTAAPSTTTKKPPKPAKPAAAPKWVIPLTFKVGPLELDSGGGGVLEDEVDNLTRNALNGTWYDIGNATKSRWMENTTYLIWMNDTEMEIPDLGKHKWVRYNVGARGLYRVAPQDREGESSRESALRAGLLYGAGGGAERALMLDDAFVLSRALRLPASRAIAVASLLRNESEWSVWLVAVSQLSWWRQLLSSSAAGPPLIELLKGLHPHPNVLINRDGKNDDQLWLSGALLTAGVEWENEAVTAQAVRLFDDWHLRNKTIPEIYQEAALVAGVRRYGVSAWGACWRALVTSYAAPRPLYSHKALLIALAAPKDDWLFYKFAFTVLSEEAQRGREWKLWITTLCTAACRWRGAMGVWRVLVGSRRGALPPPPPAALLAAAKCLHQPIDYYRFKELFGSERGASAALDTIALNAAWVPRADRDLHEYFRAVENH